MGSDRTWRSSAAEGSCLIPILANGLVVAGTCILVAACLPLRELARRLPAGPALRHWQALAGLNVLFVAGYVLYAVLFWGRHEGPASLIVPGIFFLGACFVWLTCSLALQTALDLRRMPLLERETVTDPLTGTFNRRYLERRMEEELARARRQALPLALLIVDIDHFKRINDSFGHQVGDFVIAEVARVILEAVRTSDVAARYGGEEFVIVASGTAPQMAAALGERLRGRIESREIVMPDGSEPLERIRVTASIGVASLGPKNDDARSLLAEADRALYRAKALGRNRVVAAGAESGPAVLP